MSLEQAIADLTAAVRENTERLKISQEQVTFKPAPAKKAAPAAAPVAAPVVASPAVVVAPVETPPAARVPTTDTAAPVTAAQIKAAGDDLSTLAEANRPAAVAVLAEFGVQKMTAMPQGSIPEFHAKVKAALAKLAAPSLV